MDIVGPLPQSHGYTHLLTIIDRFSKWVEAIPVKDTSATHLAEQFIHQWVAKFGVPKNITTDRGANLIASVFPHLHRLLGISHIKTTPYHPAANGMIERFHRTLKAAVKASVTKDWYMKLPLILLGFCVAIKEDVGYSPAELVYGTQLRLPTDYFEQTDLPPVTPAFVQQLHSFMGELAPPKASRHGRDKIFIHPTLPKCTHVFVKNHTAGTLNQPYDGPFLVVDKQKQWITIKKKGKDHRVNIEHIKPAFIINEKENTNGSDTSHAVKTYSRRKEDVITHYSNLPNVT